MDVFTVGCGTGYATLGAASVSRFERLQPMFEQMARSLTPVRIDGSAPPGPSSFRRPLVRELATRVAGRANRADHELG
jgi:hypothetical protein